MERGRQENDNTQFYDIIETAEAETNTDPESNPAPINTQYHYHIQQSNGNYIHVENNRRQIEALQQEAYNREVAQEAVYRQNSQLVQQGARRDVYELSRRARRRELEQQEIIDQLIARINIPASTVPQAITDQPPLQAITDQPPPQQASSSKDAPNADLFRESRTGLATIGGRTKGGWGKGKYC